MKQHVTDVISCAMERRQMYLKGAYLGLQEAFTEEHCERYKFQIGHNAHRRAEQRFDRRKQLGSTRVLWAHRYKYTHLWIQCYFLTFKLQ